MTRSWSPGSIVSRNLTYESRGEPNYRPSNGGDLLSVRLAATRARRTRGTFNIPCRPANAILDLARVSLSAPTLNPRPNAASDLLFAERFVICASRSSTLCALRIEISERRRARDIPPGISTPSPRVSLKAMIFETRSPLERKTGIKAARRMRFDLIVINIFTRATRARVYVSKYVCVYMCRSLENFCPDIRGTKTEST